MKTLYIQAKRKTNANKAKILELSKQLPKQIAIAYSIQYQNLALEVKTILSKKHKITSISQVLGCSKPKFPKTTQAILLIGSGRFHAVALALETKLPTYILERDKLSKISEKDTESLEKKQKAGYLKFLHADKIGILISTKPGQSNLKKALDFKKQSKKKSYLFISNEINTSEFENFQIDSWVNTACPRLDMNNSSIVNIEKIKK